MFAWFYALAPLMLTGSGAGSTSIQDALTTGFSTVANDALASIAAIIPIALPILGAIVVVMVGIRLFKRVSK